MTDRRAALVVVDVQNGFITADSAHVIPVITKLAQEWQTAGEHVVFTRYFNYPGSQYERLVGWRELQGPPETDLVGDLAPLVSRPRTHVIDKTVYTAFTPGPGGGKRLFAGHRFTDLFICGIATDGCVLATALDAFQFGYTPWVLSDAVASNATSTPPAEVHAAGLLLMGRLIGKGQIITAADARARLPLAAQSCC